MIYLSWTRLMCQQYNEAYQSMFKTNCKVLTCACMYPGMKQKIQWETICTMTLMNLCGLFNTNWTVLTGTVLTCACMHSCEKRQSHGEKVYNTKVINHSQMLTPLRSMLMTRHFVRFLGQNKLSSIDKNKYVSHFQMKNSWGNSMHQEWRGICMWASLMW